MLDNPELLARARWSAAEDHLYPTLVLDHAGYQRALAQIRAVVEELRTRCRDLPGLMAAEASAEEILAAACPNGRALPSDLLMGAACAMRAREISAGAQQLHLGAEQP